MSMNTDHIEPCPDCEQMAMAVTGDGEGRRVICACGYIGPWGGSPAEAMNLWDVEAIMCGGAEVTGVASAPRE